MSQEPSFRAVRRSRTFHLLAQAALLLTFFGGINFLIGHAGGRFDLTARHRHSLSTETLAYLKNLRQLVHITSTLDESAGEDTNRDITELLAEYSHATEHNPASGRVVTDTINVTQRAREAKQRGLTERANILLVSTGEGDTARRHFIDLSELYRMEKGEKVAFLGEQAITSAVLDVTSAKRKKIYFLTGHGEMSVEGLDSKDMDRGLAILASQLYSRDLALAPLALAREAKVPDDAALVVVAGPQGPVQPEEAARLTKYLDNAGRLLVLLAPKMPRGHGLDDLLEKWGVLVDDVLVYDSGPGGQTDTGDLILSANSKDDHPVIHTLASNHLYVRFGATRTARLDLGRKEEAGLHVTELIGTGPTAWGERDYDRAGPPVFNRDRDLSGPFAVATASERVSTGGNKPVPSGRLVVFGSADWVANSRVGADGNLTLFLAAVNWTVDRGPGLGDVPARPIERVQLTLTSQQLQHLRYALVFALPGAAALLGLAVFWARRR